MDKEWDEHFKKKPSIVYKWPKDKQKMSAPIIGRQKAQNNVIASLLQEWLQPEKETRNNYW